MRRTFTVSIELPPGVDTSTMAEYIRDAIANWTGGMDPQHPLGCKDLVPVVRYQISGIQLEVS